ncbi:uncharacterized protein [Macrobrachium rosenbergii]|uniref:uncharacterized protein isoform X1 n=1 Tax=Macrobrachium rosenbergii TaxID=79674 RepID=UPI0034D50957
MSTAAPRSCLKPPIRNPWVADDGGESSTSSGQQQQQSQQQHHSAPLDVGSEAGTVVHAHLSHDLLAHQYATPYHSSTSGAPSLTVVSGARSTHSVGQHAPHGVVHSHTAHSLHSATHSIPTAAHSVHSVPGTLQQPWVDPQLLWSTPALPSVGVGGGVFTVGGGGGGPADGSCPSLPPGVYPQTHPVLHSLHSLHLGGGSSGQASSAGGPGVGQVGGGWGPTGPLPGSYPQVHGSAATGGGRNIVSASENWSRCERCHYYCFRAAQAAFVAGIVTGFSLLVAGGVFHRKHIDHLQVLVYIGAMVSLVCVVLLVIFCAMNKDHRTRRGTSGRFSGPQVVGGDPETVPLRPLESNNPPVIIAENVASHGSRVEAGVMSTNELVHKTNHSSCIAPPNQSSCMAVSPPTSHGVCCVPPSSQGGCVIGPNNQTLCFMGPGTHNAGSVIGTSNKGLGTVATSEPSHHVTRHTAQRIDEEREATQRYNRLWKQPTKAPSEATSKL